MGRGFPHLRLCHLLVPDRGEYRPIYVALLDGPDFQALPAEARWVLVVVKLSLGTFGISAVPGFEGAVAERTGLTEAAVRRALKLLTDRKWIERERNVVWLIRGLTFEPNMSPANALHRKNLGTKIESLPRLEIIRRFREFYAAWFVDGSQGPLDTPSIPPRSTETETETETLTETETYLSSPARALSPLEYSRTLTVACNRGLTDNPNLNGFRELVTSNQVEEVGEWQRQGVGLDAAAQIVYERAKAYKPNKANRQPTNLKYFRAAVLQEWELVQQRSETFVPNGRKPKDETEERMDAWVARAEAERAREKQGEKYDDA